MKENYRPHVELLIKAFDQDPLFLELFQSENRKNQMRDMFTFLIKRNQLLDGMILTDDLKAPKYIALIDRPNPLRKNTLWNNVKNLGLMAALIFKIPLKVLNVLTRYQNKTAFYAPSEPHYYLTIVGVDPSQQGQGIGGALLKKLDEVRMKSNHSYPIALDTENERNVAYYEKFGYQLTQKEAVGTVMVYCMRKT